MLETKSTFTFGHTITQDNQSMPFSEDGIIELVASFRIGAYTLNDFATEMARAMNEVGTLNYIKTLDRTTRKITISGDSNFHLYVVSSTLTSASPYSLLGFTTERTGSSTYEGDLGSGFAFNPQFLLQKYVDFKDNQMANEVTVNESASGKVQVVKYGNINFMECNITLQTNIRQEKGSIIDDSATGEDDLRSFMQYITTKAPIEFIQDRDNQDVYKECFLEKTSTNKDGTGFKLKELYAKKMPFWWESGLLTFREIK